MFPQSKAEIDLFDRQEERFFIPLDSTKRFLQGINRILRVKRFSDYEVVETIYFNNFLHEVPWGKSFKARRYKKDVCSDGKIKISESQGYLLEMKKESDRGSYSRQKERREASLKEALNFVNQGNFSMPLYPYVGDEYQRTHFVSNSDTPLRVTVDKKVSYWYFSQNSFIGEFLGEEPYLRVEIKAHHTALKSDDYRLIKVLLNKCDARPIISKKYMAYNLLCRYRTNLGQRFLKELEDCEIEAKLLIDAKDVSDVFRKIQRIYSNKGGGFRIEKIFPYTFESASINGYFYIEKKTQREEALKFLFKGGWVKSLYKGDLEIVGNSLGLECITKRQEIKFSPYFLFSLSRYQELCEIRQNYLEGKICFLGSLMRLRKTFWIESVKTGRLYHLSIDQCTHKDDRFCQLEIEYSASPRPLMEKNSKRSIIEDIAFITNQINLSFPLIFIPTSLTKFQWLANLV